MSTRANRERLPNSSPVETALGLTQQSTMYVRICPGINDAEEFVDTGEVTLASTDLDLGDNGEGPQEAQIVGLRFVDLELPPGSTIVAAYLQFTADEPDGESAAFRIAGEASDDAEPFTSRRFDLSNRAVTAAHVVWMPPAWSTPGEAGAAQRSPDLAAVLQEIVDRPGWAQRNEVVFLLTGSGRRVAKSQNGSAVATPELQVEFVAPRELPVLPHVVQVRVRAKVNDAEEDVDSGAVALASSALDLGYDGEDPDEAQIVGLRFADLALPPGSTIVAAHLQFTADEPDRAPTVLQVAGEASDDAAPFRSADFDY